MPAQLTHLVDPSTRRLVAGLAYRRRFEMYAHATPERWLSSVLTGATPDTLRSDALTHFALTIRRL